MQGDGKRLLGSALTNGAWERVTGRRTERDWPKMQNHLSVIQVKRVSRVSRQLMLPNGIKDGLKDPIERNLSNMILEWSPGTLGKSVSMKV